MFNETKWHAEKQTFRAVTGGAFNIPGAYGIQSYGAVFPVVGTIPVSNPASGTIISQGVAVRGTNTKFLSELSEDDHIHAKDVVRRISQIVSDTLLYLVGGFPTDITVASSYRVCKPQIYKAIYAKSTGDADAILQEATFVSQETFLNGGSPISYDATAGQISFEMTR
jgi:hypothetical protein